MHLAILDNRRYWSPQDTEAMLAGPFVTVNEAGDLIWRQGGTGDEAMEPLDSPEGVAVVLDWARKVPDAAFLDTSIEAVAKKHGIPCDDIRFQTPFERG